MQRGRHSSSIVLALHGAVDGYVATAPLELVEVSVSPLLPVTVSGN